MWAGVDECARIGDRALADEIGPELARQVELGIDFQGFGNVDASVRPLRRVVQLAVGRMACAGIVPGLGAFLGAVLERLEHGDRKRRLELLEHGAERGAHDASADQDDIGILGLRRQEAAPRSRLLANWL